MKWHKYSDEKPKPNDICLIKNHLYYGMDKPEYLLCEYSNLGEELSEPWTELNDEAETYRGNYSEYWISISEIEESLSKPTCSKCGRDAANINYYQKDNKLYCSVCVYDILKSQKDAENMTVKEALQKNGFSIISTSKETSNDNSP